MAGIGEDIKDVLVELGTSILIYKYPGPTTITEACDHEFYSTHSSEFLRQFFSGVSLVYDSQVVSGDVVDAMGMSFIVTSISPTYFENEIVDLTAVFYRCNCVGKIQRYLQKSSWDGDYKKVRAWQDIYTGAKALQYENKFDQKQIIEADILALTIDGNILFLPSYITVKEGDRWFPDETDLTVFHRIASIDTKRLDNVSVCILKDDKRE